jgi:hypothetical protein
MAILNRSSGTVIAIGVNSIAYIVEEHIKKTLIKNL